MDTAERIKQLRERKDMSQSELARLVGVSPQSVQQWERPGGTAPKRSRLAKVAEVLGVTVGDIISEDDGHGRPMRDDVRELVDTLIALGVADKLSMRDVSLISGMIDRLISSDETAPKTINGDWMIGGPNSRDSIGSRKGRK